MRAASTEPDTITVHIPMCLERHGSRKLIIAPDGAASAHPVPERDETIIRAIVKAHRWRQRIESGKAKSITDLAAQEGVTDAYICRLLPLTCLAPDLVQEILDGRQHRGLKLTSLLDQCSLVWNQPKDLPGH